MSGLVIKGKQVEVPGLEITNWFDNPKLRLRPGQDCRARHVTWVRGIVLHTTKGIPGGTDQRPQVLRPGLGPNIQAEEKTARWWSTSPLQSGAHFVVDTDGSVGCLADAARETAFHAGPVNEYTIGIELYQTAEAELFEGQLQAMVKLVDALTKHFSIQRQFHAPYRKGPIRRLENGGADVVGIYGHRDVTSNRGQGDPGDYPLQFLEQAGYEKFDFFRGLDKVEWKGRQLWLNSKGSHIDEDGIPGLSTATALKKAGYEHGLWVQRPGD